MGSRINVALLFVCLISLLNSGLGQKRRTNTALPPDGIFLFPDKFEELKKDILDYSNIKVESRNSYNSTIFEEGLPLELAFMLNDAVDENEVIGNFVSNRDEFLTEISKEESSVLSLRFDSPLSSKTTVPSAAHCQPEQTVVHIAPDTDEMGVIYYPICTRVPRCSGCCNNRALECEAIEKVEKTYRITKLKLNPTYKFEKFEDVIVEEHVKCNCNCRIKEKDCNEFKRYVPKSCKCECKNHHEMNRCHRSRDKHWNSETCSCVCREEDYCTTGSTFNHNACACIED